MRSPRSRGKGGRRRPGRDGGRRKRKPVKWRKQATHAVSDASLLEGEVVVLEYRCPFGRSAAESIYLLDQEMANLHTRYYAELRGSRWFPVFDLYVPAEYLESVRSIIAQLRNATA